MRICSPQLRLSPGATLGGEVYDRETLTRLARLGAEVEVILPRGQPCPEVAGLRVTRSPLARGYRPPVSNAVFVPQIGALYRRRPFDLLRVHSLRYTGPGVLVARRLYRLPVPVVAHHHHVERDRWTDLVERRVLARCDLTITVSEFARRQLVAELGADPARVRVVYNGVSEALCPGPRDAALAARWRLAGQRVLLYLGGLKARKNLPVLLEALGQVLAVRQDVCLVLAGQGHEEAALRARARALGLEERVRFVGRVLEAEKAAWYNLADVFVLPSRLEGFGLVAAEAMACARPVVASRAAALPEVVAEGEAGLLCDPDAPEEFARAIVRLLGDAELAARLGAGGRARVERLFSWEASARTVLALYAEVVGRPP